MCIRESESKDAKLGQTCLRLLWQHSCSISTTIPCFTGCCSCWWCRGCLCGPFYQWSFSCCAIAYNFAGGKGCYQWVTGAQSECHLPVWAAWRWRQDVLPGSEEWWVILVMIWSMSILGYLPYVFPLPSLPMTQGIKKIFTDKRCRSNHQPTPTNPQLIMHQEFPQAELLSYSLWYLSFPAHNHYPQSVQQ